MVSVSWKLLYRSRPSLTRACLDAKGLNVACKPKRAKKEIRLCNFLLEQAAANKQTDLRKMSARMPGLFSRRDADLVDSMAAHSLSVQ